MTQRRPTKVPPWITAPVPIHVAAADVSVAVDDRPGAILAPGSMTASAET